MSLALDRAIEFELADETATRRLGQALARTLRRGDAVLLSGPLGAGKSALARAIVRAATRPDEEVPSPTFTLVQHYLGGGLALAHFDLYRLASSDEAFEIGLDEALDEGAALVEWPERLEGRLPPHRLGVEITPGMAGAEGASDTWRKVRLTPAGAWKGRVIEFRP